MAEGAIPGFRKEEDRLKLLKLRKLDEGPMEVGFTSQTTKETEKVRSPEVDVCEQGGGTQ